jgi:hypothetical protein
MTQQPPNVLSCLRNRDGQDHDAVIRMTKPPAKEPQVSREERRLFRSMQIAQQFLLVVPFRTTNLKPNLPKVNFANPKLVRLIQRDVVIEDVHAAVFLRPTSVTMPRLVRDTASRTAFGLIMPRY